MRTNSISKRMLATIIMSALAVPAISGARQLSAQVQRPSAAPVQLYSTVQPQGSHSTRLRSTVQPQGSTSKRLRSTVQPTIGTIPGLPQPVPVPKIPEIPNPSPIPKIPDIPSPIPVPEIPPLPSPLPIPKIPPIPTPKPAPKATPKSPPRGPKTINFERDIQFTYGQLLEYLTPAALDALDKGLNQDCYGTSKKRGPYSAQFKTTYKCGEVPYGKVLNSNEKSVFEMDLPKGKVLYRFKGDLTEAKKGEEAVGDIRMLSSFKLRVLMSRRQKSVNVATPLLDTKKNAAFKVREGIGETITVRHTPKAGALYSLVCGYLPGFQVRSLTNIFSAQASYTWRWWIFSATERLSVSSEIMDGILKSDYSKACATIRTTVQQSGSNYTPKVEVLDVSYPATAGLKLSGVKPRNVKVHIHTLGLKIANFILRILGKDDIQTMITKNIQDQMKKTVDPMIKATLKDVETGKVFEKMIEDTLKNKPVKDIVAAYKTAIQKGVAAQELTYKADISDLCMEYAEDYLSEMGVPFVPKTIQDYCSKLITDVAIKPFIQDKVYEKKGCYAYPHSPLPYSAKGANTWWKDQCGLSVNARVSIPIDFGEEFQCLEETLEKIKNGEPITEEEYLACAEEIISGVTGLIPEIIGDLGTVKTWSNLESEVRKTGASESEVRATMIKSRKVLKLK